MINKNDIDWVTNGEKGSAKTINRPLLQYIDLANNAFSEIKKSLFKINIVKKNKINGLENELIELDKNTTVSKDIEVGFKISVYSLINLTIALEDNTFISGGNSLALNKGTIKTLIKVSDNQWIHD